jgi:DEAD/DEAH box helicase domain-containing protein
VQSITEIIQAIGRQRSRGDAQPLLLLRQLEGAPGERISHLPIDGDMSLAWVAMTGEPFRPHQAHALTALRRGEPVALRASSADIATTAYLLLYATLLVDPAATALLLVPDEAAGQTARTSLAQINQELPRNLNLSATYLEPQRRPDHYARIVIAPPEVVHSRLLRHHDRAWRVFWPEMQLVVLPDMHRHDGVAAAHLADLLLRVQRVAAGHAGGQLPNLLGTLVDIANPEPVLTSLLGTPWRVVGGDDGPRDPTTLAVWRGGPARLRDAIDIATGLQRHGYQVHIACRPAECATLAPMIGDIPRVTFGPDLLASNVLVAAGYPGSHSALRRMLRAGYQAVILVLGELPHEQALGRHVETLLTDPATSWPPPSHNAYVTAQHMLCAASEQPLTEEEVELWGAQDIAARLVAGRA